MDVSLDDDARRDVRQSNTMANLTAKHPERHSLIEDLVRARLLSKTSVEDGAGRTERVDIIHESLLRNWDRLASAIHDQRTTLQRRARFRDDLAQWETSGLLLEGVRLAAALDLAQNDDTVTQSTTAITLIKQSVAVRDAEQSARNAEREERLRQAVAAAEANRQRAEIQTRLTQCTRRLSMVVLVLFVLSLGATGFAVNRQQVAQQESYTRATAEAQALEQKTLPKIMLKNSKNKNHNVWQLKRVINPRIT